ncbi:hypothetical protein [Aeromonas veronii]|uniref:hypothetical protein n=1 Tax=Aeromonas veronii TaxID=654 RepID=UPI003D1C0009
MKFSELAIFILNQEINYPVQPPPAQTFGKGHLARGGPFYLSMLFTDIKLVGFFSNIPLELAFGKKIRRITVQALSSGCHPSTSRTHSRTSARYDPILSKLKLAAAF